MWVIDCTGVQCARSAGHPLARGQPRQRARLSEVSAEIISDLPVLVNIIESGGREGGGGGGTPEIT